MCSVPCLAQDSTTVKLSRFEIVRVDQADINRVPNDLRSIFADPVPDSEPVSDLSEATKRVGFTARLPKSDKPPQFGIVAPVGEQLKISVSELRKALQDAKAADLMVPDSWDGVTIELQQRSGVFADFGKFFLVQAPILTLTMRSSFPLDQFVEVLCRVLGMDAAQARSIRQTFMAMPMAFFPVPRKYDMDVHQVKLRAGSGTLFENGSKQGEMALAWSDADRNYFLSGLLTEAEAIAIADSIQ
ncbi:MAG TPA: hypothetical protein VGK48_29060 [Terriglobia bacterium]